MERYFAKTEPWHPLHIIVRKEDVTSERLDVIGDAHFLQLAVMKLPKGKTFRAHKHIRKGPYQHSVRTQESWIVIQGKVKAILYDLDDTIIAEPILNAGDCSITLNGGHNYEILEEGSIIYEYKTGPYFGQEKDKVFI